MPKNNVLGQVSRQERLADKGDWTLMAHTIPGAAQCLKRGDADFIIIASNRLNSFAETVEQEGNVSQNKPT